MYLAFSCPTVFIHKFVDQPTLWVSDLSSSQITGFNCLHQTLARDHSKGHQRLCSLLDLDCQANDGKQRDVGISLYLTVNIHPLSRSFKKFFGTTSHILPKTHVYMLHFGDFTLINLDLGSSRGETYSGENYWSRNKVDMQYALKLRRAHAVGRKEILRSLTMPSHPQPRLSL